MLRYMSFQQTWTIQKQGVNSPLLLAKDVRVNGGGVLMVVRSLAPPARTKPRRVRGWSGAELNGQSEHAKGDDVDGAK